MKVKNYGKYLRNSQEVYRKTAVMGYYTNIKCIAKVKKQYREAIFHMKQSYDWGIVKKKFPEHNTLVENIEKMTVGATNIPFWTSAYIQDCWNNGEQCHHFNKKNGHWYFICSIKDYDESIKSFVRNIINEVCYGYVNIEIWYEEGYGPIECGEKVEYNSDGENEEDDEPNEFISIVHIEDDV